MLEKNEKKASGSHPFESDVNSIGRYVYTGDGASTSASFANARQSQLVADGVLALNGSTLLDVGCGDGTYTWELAEHFPLAVTGIDPASNAIEVAKKLRSRSDSAVSIDFIAGDLESTVLASGRRFDIAVVRGVLHHVGDPASLIRQLAQCSESVVIIEPNGLNPILKLIERVSPYHRKHMERSFAPWRVRTWLESAGWTIKVHRVGGIVPFFFPERLAILLRAVEPAFENIPGFRWLVCGSQMIVAVR